jgi:tetratricopeptide (TPR) repeat protein
MPKPDRYDLFKALQQQLNDEQLNRILGDIPEANNNVPANVSINAKITALLDWAETVEGPGWEGVVRVATEYFPDFKVGATGSREVPPVFQVPHGRNEYFTGRETEIKTLRTNLRQTRFGAIIQAISGLGGVGKTALAVEYVYVHREEYRHIFWIGAESDLLSQFANLALTLKLCSPQMDAETRSKLARGWLEQNEDWLLVFDNATNAESLEKYTPKGGGHVLITSRARGGFGRTELRLEVWDEGTAVRYLLDRLSDTKEEDKENRAKRLAKALGYLPLALSQAASYMKRKVVSLKTYLQRFESTEYHVLEEGKADAYETTVAKTWNISFEVVREAVGEFTYLEPYVLALFTTLVPDDIPRVVFQAVSVIEQGLERWLEELNHYSLIELGESKVSVHRLVQRVMQASPKCPDRRASLELTLPTLVRAYPEGDFEHRGLLAELLPHWEECWKGIGEERIVSKEAGALLNQFGCYLNAQGRYAEAEPLFMQALEKRQNSLPAEHPDIAQSLNNLAVLYDTQGRYEEAEPLYKQALEMVQNSLPAEHPDIAQSLNNLAVLYDTQGRYEEAEPLHKQALEKRQNSLPAGHPSIAGSLNNLALLYDNQGRYEEAEPLHKQALEIMEAALGRNHPNTQTLIRNLFLFYAQQEKREQASEVMERHPEVILPMLLQVGGGQG